MFHKSQETPQGIPRWLRLHFGVVVIIISAGSQGTSAMACDQVGRLRQVGSSGWLRESYVFVA